MLHKSTLILSVVLHRQKTVFIDFEIFNHVVGVILLRNRVYNKCYLVINFTFFFVFFDLKSQNVQNWWFSSQECGIK